MRLHYMRDIEGNIEEPTPENDLNDEVLDWDTTSIVGADTEEGFISLYTDGGRWYITMTHREAIQILGIIIRDYIRDLFR